MSFKKFSLLLFLFFSAIAAFFIWQHYQDKQTKKEKEDYYNSIYLLVFFSFLAIFGLWMLLSYDKTEPEPKFKEEFTERPASKIDDIQIKQLEEGRIITIESPDVNDHFDIGHEKFYQQEWRRNISLGIDDERQKKGEYYFLHSYDIDTKKEGKKIDIFALIRKYNPNAGVKLPGEVVYYQGKDYFHITLQEQDKKKKGFYPLKEVLIDLETEEVIDYFQDINNKESTFSSAILATKIYDTVSDPYDVNFRGNRLRPSLEKHTNIPTGLNISQEHPELVQKLNEGKIKVFVRQGDNSYEEWFNLIMHWFAPVGQDRLALSITDKDTGEVTSITSYQDYLAWRESHPKDSEVQGSE